MKQTLDSKHVKKTILVVEDDKSERDALVDALRQKGFAPIEAGNGKEGVKLALAHHPDMILMDLMMPMLNGMAALQKIRQNTWGAHVPVIILTNVSATDEQLVEDMVTHKPMNYLVKSDWKIYDIIKKIEQVLKM